MNDQHDDKTKRGSFSWAAFFLALPFLYASGLVFIQFIWGTGAISDEKLQVFAIIFMPIIMYLEAGYWGSDLITIILNWAFEAGEAFR